MTSRPAYGGLTCSEVLAHLSDYLDGDLASDLRTGLEAHVRECPDCARFGGAFAAVLQRLRDELRSGAGWGAAASGESLDPGVAARLDEALRRVR